MDENEGKTQEVCKRKDSPVKEIFVDQDINTLKIKLSYEHSKDKLSDGIESSSSNMIHGTAVWSSCEDRSRKNALRERHTSLSK